MLPAWATVAIAIGVSLIGALAGLTGAYFGFRSSTLALAHQGREGWRTRLVEAAQSESDAWIHIETVLWPSVSAGVPLGSDQRREFEAALTTYAQALQRVILLFGKDTSTGSTAHTMQERVVEGAFLVWEEATPWDDATRDRVKDMLSEADTVHDALMREMNLAIRPESWNSP